ncbi:bifunctional 5,10-methylene-tetrahydrofolate dehydrogenase/5,10-methylene-tetrahydrofolate cyclohydrolase [Patescibacteria group bacterium]|nr:bifunctional 5,10-methylene-tetrahydrofolate dehydrogenase/5,10-methylene-tetrahydrofolate cyclohydrolase [Patescibacteria group bacterium]
MVQILDGLKVSESVLEQVKKDVVELEVEGIMPKLVVVVVGEDPGSQVYVGHKEKACKNVGILFEKRAFDASISQEDLIKVVEELNEDKSVHGFIVQLPLPKHISVPLINKAIDPRKDVDGFTAYNLGKMFISQEFEDMAPCTPKGIIKILDYYNVDVSGMDAVVVGRSNIVGKPIASMLLNRGATVAVCHSKTKNLTVYTKWADLLVVAAGVPNLINEDMVKEGSVIIDVGMNRLENGKLCGDVNFDTVKDKVAAITPVPGGVGPMTVACLMESVAVAARKQTKK